MSFKIAVCFFVPLISLSCTTLSSMERQSADARGGVVELYDVDVAQAMALADYACQVLSFNIESRNDNEKFIVADNGISSMSWGERIGIYFTELSKNQTEVRIVSKAKVKTNIFSPEWSRELHTHMQSRLVQLGQTTKAKAFSSTADSGYAQPLKQIPASLDQQIKEIEAVAELRDKGLLTGAEYQAKKKEILNV